jgi:hypothetical protein
LRKASQQFNKLAARMQQEANLEVERDDRPEPRTGADHRARATGRAQLRRSVDFFVVVFIGFREKNQFRPLPACKTLGWVML